MSKVNSGKIQDVSSNNFLNLGHSLKNVLISYLVSIILLFITAIIATYLSLSDDVLNILVIIITGLCLIITGFRAARHSKCNGLLNGIIAGVFYTIILYFIGCIVSKSFAITFINISTFALGICCGGLGGIIGVNMKNKTKKR
ncbi:MAG: TIGR04086 family membrane protein [Oscillospiraceae bacterium]